MKSRSFGEECLIGISAMTTLGQSALSSTDTAALNGITLAVETHNITASYSGATDFAGSTSQAVTVVVELLAGREVDHGAGKRALRDLVYDPRFRAVRQRFYVYSAVHTFGAGDCG